LCTLPTYAGTITGILQGPSGLPIKNGTLGFQLQQAGLIVGTGSVVPTTAYCYSSTDGSVVGLPNPLALPIVATQTSGAGNLPSGIYYVEETFYNASGETLVSPELQIQLSSQGSLIVSLPNTVPTNATGVKVYIGLTRGSETLQGTFNSAFPATYAQTVALATGTMPPVVNSAPCTIAFNDTIIPYQGYNVSLVSSSGNAYPGWPQSWQLNGGASGTVNVSAGAPLWNGVVIYPQPILSQPLNHGPQGISGNLDFGGYNVTNVGTFTSGVVNTNVNAALQSGTDIGAKANSSIALCGSQCEIDLPAGSQSFATTIVLPLNIYGTYILKGSPGAVLTYTGTGCAIQTAIGQNGPGESQLIIEGFQLNGTILAQCGIHMMPTNRITVRNMNLQGFSGGDAILVEGTNSSNIYDNLITNSLRGIHLIPTLCNTTYPFTCSPGNTGGQGYTPNNIHIIMNQIADNLQWGVFDDRDAVTAGLTGSLNDVLAFNDMENNGLGTTAYGSFYATHSIGWVISANYFEGSPRAVVLGELGAGTALGTNGAQILSNYFTTSANTKYNIELQNAFNTQISGNSELIAPGTGGTNCDINVSTGGETGTFFGKNNFTQVPPFGNLLCIAGANAVTFAGAGSYMQFNMNYLPKIVDQNAVMTAAASDVFESPTVTAASACYATAGQNGTNPSASASAQAIIAQVYVLAANGSFTVYHPTTTAAGFIYNIFCTNSLN
jgi:hypothetical protein